MVAGRLQEKNGFYYIVLSYTDSAGKRGCPQLAGIPFERSMQTGSARGSV